MDTVVRATIIYGILLVIFRVAGKRSLAQITTFDLILALIISEAIQQALLGHDSSMTSAFLVVVTLVGMDIGLSLVKQHFPVADKWLDDVPLVIVDQGRPLKDRMDRSRVDESDIMAAARALQGLERMDQIKYAVLERGGEITVVPQK